MNAPENINSLRQEIAQHLASTGEATAKQIAEAILQEKVEVARVLNDMHKSAEVEREKKRGNEYVYWLSAAAAAPDDYEIPPANPALLAMANKMLGDRLEGVAHVLRGCGLPLLADASGAEDLQPKVAALAGAYQMALADLRSHEACLEAKDSELLAQAKVVVDLRDRLDALTQQWEADTGRITADLQAALKSRSQAINESDRLRAEHEDSTLLGVIADIRTAVGDTEGRVMLGDLAGHIEAMLGTLVSKTADLQIQVEEQESRNGSLVTDVSNTRNALAHAINESDRLRNELIIERQAREELLEQDGVDVKDAAVGYLVRVTKRKPRYVTQPERARDAALAAVRAGAGRAEVLAVVPVGVARRGAEWRGSAPQTKGG